MARESSASKLVFCHFDVGQVLVASMFTCHQCPRRHGLGRA